MKAKLTKFGIKYWVLVSSTLIYVSNIIFYLRANDEQEEGESMSEDAVLKEVWDMEWRRHIIIMDNYFTFVKLFEELM